MFFCKRTKHANYVFFFRIFLIQMLIVRLNYVVLQIFQMNYFIF